MNETEKVPEVEKEKFVEKGSPLCNRKDYLSSKSKEKGLLKSSLDCKESSCKKKES